MRAGWGPGSRLWVLPPQWLGLDSPASLSALFKKRRKRSLTPNYFNMPENETYLGADNLFCGQIGKMSETKIKPSLLCKRSVQGLARTVLWRHQDTHREPPRGAQGMTGACTGRPRCHLCSTHCSGSRSDSQALHSSKCNPESRGNADPRAPCGLAEPELAFRPDPRPSACTLESGRIGVNHTPENQKQLHLQTSPAMRWRWTSQPARKIPAAPPRPRLSGGLATLPLATERTLEPRH